MTESMPAAASQPETPPASPSQIIPAAYIGIDGERYRVRVPVRTIWLSRAEGPSAQCRDWTFKSYASANTRLARNAFSAPEGGAYDKHDFEIVFADGARYRGRYDLSREETNPSIGAHARQYLSWIASDPQAEALFGADDRRGAAEFLETHDFDQHVPAAAPENWPVLRDYRSDPCVAGEVPLARHVYGLA